MIPIAACAIALLIPACALSAQTPARDTAAAAALARELARDEVVGSYFIGGAVAAPLTIVSVAIAASGESLDPRMAIGPGLWIFTGARASRSNLPLDPSMEGRLAEMDSLSKTVFRRTYDETLKSRRRSAMFAGNIVGVLGSLLLLLLAAQQPYT